TVLNYFYCSLTQFSLHSPYQTTDFSFYKNSFEVNKLEVASGSAFKNAANGEFYLKNSILEKEKVGDPRWIR
ncbi:DUF5123 domain-containing protein, partial [Segatella sp.]|uniref:DUF5123 domain-containing protein n=1 Tax=Segatella sp. TaxID=2974253 RepID=UPI0030790E7E